MKITELAHDPKTTPESNLVTALELIRQRFKDKARPPKISTKSLINLVLNTDRTFDYDTLVAANEENPAVKNLIKSFNKDFVELQPFDSSTADDTITNVDGDSTKNPVDDVSSMAKRAGKKRDADLF